MDLDLGVVRTWDNRVMVLDEDEFVENAAHLGYPPGVVESAKLACEDVLARMAGSQWPFDGSHLRLAQSWWLNL